jgi:hypothetical protein
MRVRKLIFPILSASHISQGLPSAGSTAHWGESIFHLQ